MKKTVLISFLVLCLSSTLVGLASSIQSVKADWTWTETIYVRADGSVEPDTAPISSIDNITYTLTDNIVGDVPEYSSVIVVERDHIMIDGAGYNLQGTGAWKSKGIYLLKRNNVTITNVEIKAFREGIYLWNSSNNNLSMNIITNCEYGISLWWSSNNRISGNNVRLSTQPTPTSDDVDAGVAILYSSTYNTVFGNNIENAFAGIRLPSSSNNNIVSGNNVKNNYYGITVSSNYNIVSGNNVTSGRSGIHLGHCSNNTVSGNNVTDNEGGINLYPQALNNLLYKNHIVSNVRGIVVWEASYNSIYSNNFINNSLHVEISTSGDFVNFWDNGYPSGGNYWFFENYVGVDLNRGSGQNETGSDGIGDYPHRVAPLDAPVELLQFDNYPLMGMFSDFNATSEHQVQTICNSTISHFQFNGTAISFNVTGENGTVGFCRTCIPTALMNDTYTVFVNGTEVSHTLLPCSNSTHNYLYFTYNHSTQEVIIIPEFPSFPLLPLFMIATLLAAILYRRQHSM